jgi:hypothetical protein
MNVIDSYILRSGMRAENRYTLFPHPAPALGIALQGRRAPAGVGVRGRFS